MKPNADPASFTSPPVPVRIELTIERLVVDAPPGVRPELLRAEIERHLRTELETRAGQPAPEAGTRETLVSERSIQASRHPGSYAARIASNVTERIWE